MMTAASTVTMKGDEKAVLRDALKAGMRVVD
jgi:hypothetical protein